MRQWPHISPLTAALLYFASLKHSLCWKTSLLRLYGDILFSLVTQHPQATYQWVAHVLQQDPSPPPPAAPLTPEQKATLLHIFFHLPSKARFRAFIVDVGGVWSSTMTPDVFISYQLPP